MNAPTVPAAAAALTAQFAARLRTDPDLATPALVLTTEGPQEPADLLDHAARLLGEPDPYAQLARVRAELDRLSDKLAEAEDLLVGLEGELNESRGFAVDAYELLTLAAAHLTRLQESDWDYDRAAWLERVRPLLAVNPYQPVTHLPGQGRPRRLVDADRLRVAAHAIHTADALHLAAGTGDPAAIRQAAEGYDRARRLYAQHAAAADTPTAVVIDTTLDHHHDEDGREPADVAAATAGVR